MKKVISVLFSMILLTGCTTTNSIPEEFNAKMMSEETQTSVIYSYIGGYGDQFIVSPHVTETDPNITFKVKLYLEQNFYDAKLDEYEEYDKFACSTIEEFDEGFEMYYSRYEELKLNYRELLIKLENPVEEAKINDEVIIGIEVIEDGKRNTAYLYSNNVMKFNVDDQIEYYILTDEEVDEWGMVYFDYIEYYIKEEFRPCWQRYK